MQLAEVPVPLVRTVVTVEDRRFFEHFGLDLQPRISVPTETRFYRDSRSIPRYAVTLEIGTGVGVVF